MRMTDYPALKKSRLLHDPKLYHIDQFVPKIDPKLFCILGWKLAPLVY